MLARAKMVRDLRRRSRARPWLRLCGLRALRAYERNGEMREREMRRSVLRPALLRLQQDVVGWMRGEHPDESRSLRKLRKAMRSFRGLFERQLLVHLRHADELQRLVCEYQE